MTTPPRVTPLREDVISVEPPGLKGVACSACRQRSFPLREFCPFCGSVDLEEVVLSGHGKVASWTVVHQAPPPLPTPYRLVTVDLDDGVRLLGQAVGSPEIDSDVNVELFELKFDDSGNPLWWYRFREVRNK